MKFKAFLSQLLASSFVLSVVASSVFAQGTAAPAVPAGDAAAAAVATGAGPAPQQPGGFAMLFPMIAIFGVFYFLMIRPQQKKMKEQQNMIAALKHGDEVVTTSGILGTIHGIAEKVVTLEVAKEVRIKILKSQIAQVVKGQIQDLPVQ